MVRAPPRILGLPAPRPKLRPYKYFADDSPPLPAILFDIIDGLPVQQVEPELYPQLLPLLRERERALKEWRNQPASRAIADAIAYVEGYRYADDPQQLRPRALRTTRITADRLSATELSLHVNMAMRGEVHEIDPRHYRVLIRELQRIKTAALAESDYLLAERAGNASRRVIALTSDNRFREIANGRVDALSEQLQIKSADRDELVERSAREIAAAERRRDDDIRRMARAHEAELRKFDEQFEMDPPPELRKFSPTLLQLRVREKYMVQSGRYREATRVREEAGRLEKREIEQQRERWAEQLKFQKMELEKKQEERIFVRRMNADHQIAQLRRATAAAVEHQAKAVQHLEHQFKGATTVQSFAELAEARPRTSRRGGNAPKIKVIDHAAVMFRRRAIINTAVYSKTAQSSPGSPRAVDANTIR
jgi:hypothetical protein